MLPIQGKSVLGHVIERLQRCRNLERVVVATTLLERDLVVAEEAGRFGALVFRGDESDVLGRYARAAETFGLTTVMRVTSDCPLIDPSLLDEMLGAFEGLQGRVDFLCNNLPRTFPIGLDAEVFTLAALLTADREAELPEEREHVSPFVRSRPERFRIRGYTQADNQAKFRLTLDTREDFQVIESVFDALYPSKPHFDRHAVTAYLNAHPEVVKLNAHLAK